MPESTINCTGCGMQLRVPEEMVGKLVRCPTCSATFTVALPQTIPEAAAASLSQTSAEVRNAVRPPAICVLVTVVVALILNGLLLLWLSADPETLRDELRKGTREQLDQARKGKEKLDEPADRKKEEEELDKVIDWTIAFMRYSSMVSAVLSIVIVAGTVQLLRMRSYALGMASSVLAMLLIWPGCCVLSFPFGLWLLLVLMRPEVRRLRVTTMPARIICPHCQRHLRLPDDLYEGPAQCPCCQGGFAVRWYQRGLRRFLKEDEENARRTCRSCGEKIPQAARECPFCGAWVKARGG